MRVRTFLAHWERALWVAAFAIVLTVQWPMLKGMYYRAVKPAARQSTIAWHTDLAAALDESRRTGRPVLADFSAAWCPPCITMKHDVWPDDDVEREVAAAYVPLRIDVDRDPAAADRFRVSGIPTILVLDGDGLVVRSAGYLPVSGMLRFLRERDGQTDASF